jgi:4-hydroxybenzoate polyprenyltransferase
MAAARTLDVLLGASTASTRRALPVAAVMGAHTLTITVVSRREVSGAPRSVAHLALAATAAIGAAAATLTLRTARGSFARALALALLGAYTASMVGAEATAANRPDPSALQHLVKTGVMAFLPLQASLVSARGLSGPALLLAVAWPTARALAQRIAVT